jgi:hypothetical protein
MTRQARSQESRPFVFSGSGSDSPTDMLQESIAQLAMLTALLDRHSDLQGDAILGLLWTLNGLWATLRSVERLVTERIDDPFAAGYREGYAAAERKPHAT